VYACRWTDRTCRLLTDSRGGRTCRCGLSLTDGCCYCRWFT